MDLSGLDRVANRYPSGISITLQLVIFSVLIGAAFSGLLTAARLSPLHTFREPQTTWQRTFPPRKK